jgi:hypothetical protein
MQASGPGAMLHILAWLCVNGCASYSATTRAVRHCHNIDSRATSPSCSLALHAVEQTLHMLNKTYNNRATNSATDCSWGRMEVVSGGNREAELGKMQICSRVLI